MTVENTNPIQHFTANGETTVFAISFAVEGKDNIKVTVDGTDVSINDYSYNALTNSVVFNTAPVDGVEVVVERVTSLERSINYQTYNNSFRPETLNYDLDRIWHVLQEQNIVDAEILARIKEEIEWRRTQDDTIRAEIAEEVEARRNLDLNYDTLARVRELQVFDALKSYTDTYIAATDPSIFGGVTAGVVFALDKKSVQTHLEDIYAKLVDERQALQVEENRAKAVEISIDQRAKNAEQNLDQKIEAEQIRATSKEAQLQSNISQETDRATIVEQSLQSQINAVGVGNKAYTTYTTMVADKANIPAKSKITVTNDPIASNNGDYQYDGTAFTKSAYDTLTQSKNYIDQRVDALGFITGVDPDIVFSLTDKNGQRTWIEANTEGKPTNYSTSVIAEVLEPVIENEILESGIEQSDSLGLSVAIVDSENKRTWLEADLEGKPTDHSAKCITDILKLGEIVVPSLVKSAYNSKEFKAVSGPDIVCWGDSMTAGAGGNGRSYPLILGELLTAAGSTAKVVNAGVGGETSVTITARQGGTPFIVRVIDKIIPATITPVTIAFDQIDSQTVRPLLQGNGAPGYGFTGKLADVEGTISLVKPNGGNTWDAANYYTFTRKTVGAEVAVTRPETFYLDFANAHLGDIHIIWIGQNGPSTARAITDAKAIIQRMEALNKRYIVISKPSSTAADDSIFFAEFGSRFLPIRKYMVEFGLEDAGITPTEQDLTDIANGTVPTSLRTDAVHWTAQGYTILANQIFKKLKELGWI